MVVRQVFNNDIVSSECNVLWSFHTVSCPILYHVPYCIMSHTVSCPTLYHVPYCIMSHTVSCPILYHVPYCIMSHTVSCPILYHVPYCIMSHTNSKVIHFRLGLCFLNIKLRRNISNVGITLHQRCPINHITVNDSQNHRIPHITASMLRYHLLNTSFPNHLQTSSHISRQYHHQTRCISGEETKL